MRRGAVIAGIVTLLAAASAGAAEPPLGDLDHYARLQEFLADVADRVRPSVVAIRADRRLTAPDGDELGKTPDDELHRRLRERLIPAVGSGTIIGAEGLILTNEHVVHGADPEHIECTLFDGGTYTVREITSDPRSDLAVVRIDARDLQPAVLGDLAAVRQGYFAIVVGNPFGAASENLGNPSMSFGVISAVGQVLTDQLDASQNRYYGNLIQTDARINPGNSGGPLLNIRGEVIGINTAISTRSGGSEGVGYAISIDGRIRDIIGRLAQGQEVEYGFLGVNLEAPTPEQRRAAGGPDQGGGRIIDVTLGTPADAAKLRAGDIIFEFTGQRVQSVDHLVRLVGATRADTRVEAKLFRDRKAVTVEIVPAGRQGLPGINVFSWRGMRLDNLTPSVRSQFDLPETAEGVAVTQVQANGPAAQAGLKAGHVIRQAGEITLRRVGQLRQIAPRLKGPIKIILDDASSTELTLP